MKQILKKIAYMIGVAILFLIVALFFMFAFMVLPIILFDIM